MVKRKITPKFIVIEGIDGAGGGTQSNLLFNFFKKEKTPTERLIYPDPKGPIGKLIHEFLHKKYEFSPFTQFLLYSTDFLKDKEKIERWKKERKTIIADRYFTSTLAYQCLKGFPLGIALKMAKLFEMPRPDLIIYLKISPETSIRRKFKEKRSLDRHERDKNFLRKLGKFYEKLIKKQIFSRWIAVDGEKPAEEVSEEIKKYI